MGSQGGPNKIAVANFLWLHFLTNRSSIQSFLFEISETRGANERSIVYGHQHGSGDVKCKSRIALIYCSCIDEYYIPLNLPKVTRDNTIW